MSLKSASRFLVPQRVRLARLRRQLTQDELADRLGVSGRQVRTYEGGASQVGTDVAPHQSPLYFLARKKTYERSWFDLAPELGHLILNREGTRKPGPQEEREANAFAAAFRLPCEGICEYLHRNPTIEDILRLKKVFVVSAVAMTRAAHGCGRLSDWA